MENAVHRPARRRRRRNSNPLMLLIVVLAVILVVLLVVALSVPRGDDQDDPGSNHTGSTTTAPLQLADLTLTAPAQTEFMTMENAVEFAGTADPREALTIGGQKVTVSEDGAFRHTVSLQSGVNEIAVAYRGETVTYRIEHRAVIQYATPEGGQFGCGATLRFSAAIRAGAELTVTFNGKEIAMEKDPEQLGANLAEGFELYTGTCVLPSGHTQDLDMGVITFTATADGTTETLTSGNIICQKQAEVLKSDPSVTPDGGSYVDVGSGYIVEILNNSAETFEGSDVDRDPSRPNINYLPQGTVDYGYVEDIENGTKTIRLRCGRRVYTAIRNYPPISRPPVVETYIGTLPDHNEIGFGALTQSSDYTVLTLDVLWKAPFYFELLPQRYVNPEIEDWRVESFTAEYVEITFCYATKFTGTVEIPANNPLFSHAELKQNEHDATLRLYLREKGGFRGWDAYYNEAGQLCFRFINPKTVEKTNDNSYGVDLSGINIMLDVGHGGMDGGTQPDGAPQDEAFYNLQLAQKIKKELESMGATVTLNRTDDSAITVQERIAMLKEAAPDLCIAVHQNSGESASYNGGWICYYTPYSELAARLIYNETKATGIYQKTLLELNKYYVARETVCPVVLLENGFMSNAHDLETISNETIQLQKAQAVARGIAKYFLQVNP